MSRESSIIEVEELERMTEAEKEKWERRSIYKLPACVRNTNKTAYTPQMVSFGPYHYGNENLKEMELHKERALNRFLKRSRINYNHCRESLLEIVGELMDAYESLDSTLYNKESPNAFLDIMIRDGIFLLEIIGDGEKKTFGYADNDPIFGKDGTRFYRFHIRGDMLMLENQIPMKVLHRLYQLQYGGEDANKVVLQYLFPDRKLSSAPTNSLHLLDMYRTVISGPYPPSITEGELYTCVRELKIIKSAVELTEAGIKIKISRSGDFRDISFDDGVLRLPSIIIDSTTEWLSLNLIAYERFHVRAGKDVTAYFFFMDNIIDDARDVRLLRSLGILYNGISSDSAAAEMFNSLSRNISLSENSSMDENNPHAEIYRRVSIYCRRRIPRYRAALCHTYFTNPWTIIAFVAAIIYFALTTTQTTYGIMDFYKK